MGVGRGVVGCCVCEEREGVCEMQQWGLEELSRVMSDELRGVR